MTRIVRVMFLLVAVIGAMFLSDATAARKQTPTDQLSQALQQAGLKELENEVVRQIGQAVEVGAPLRLDQRTAFPPAAGSIDNFHPADLELTPENANHALPPGDYSIEVTGFCTKWSLHYPGRGLPYRLARLQGRHADAVSALVWRGTLKGLKPTQLKAMAWRIQGGLPLNHWRPAEQALVHELIPEYEASLNGDFLEQTRSVYDQARKIGKLPRYETMLGSLGPVGEAVLDLQRARRVLANKTLAAERMPDLLYGRPRDGLPRTLTGGANDPPSAWSEIAPGLFARMTIIKGDMGPNTLDIRITPEARMPSTGLPQSQPSSGVRHSTQPRILPAATVTYEEEPEAPWTFWGLFRYISSLIAYPDGRPAQALITVPRACKTYNCGWGDLGIRG